MVSLWSFSFWSFCVIWWWACDHLVIGPGEGGGSSECSEKDPKEWRGGDTEFMNYPTQYVHDYIIVFIILDNTFKDY